MNNKILSNVSSHMVTLYACKFLTQCRVAAALAATLGVRALASIAHLKPNPTKSFRAFPIARLPIARFLIFLCINIFFLTSYSLPLKVHAAVSNIAPTHQVNSLSQPPMPSQYLSAGLNRIVKSLRLGLVEKLASFQSCLVLQQQAGEAEVQDPSTGKKEKAAAGGEKPASPQSKDGSGGKNENGQAISPEPSKRSVRKKADAKRSLARPARRLANPAVELAIQKGISFLKKSQKGTGAFTSEFPIALTSLSGLALLGAGVQYKRGPHGQHLRRAIDYMLSPQRSAKLNGYLSDGESRMHGHAYAILFLAQAMGTISEPSREKRLRKVVSSGIEVILHAQTIEGGWGYEPDKGKRFDESSITVCCLQAIRAAKGAGIELVDQNGNSRLAQAVQRAVSYLQRCCNEDGSFRYSLQRGVGRSSFALTAAAVCTLDAAGDYASKEHKKGIQYMEKCLRPYWGTASRKTELLKAADRYPFYANFYAGQAYHQLGDPYWPRWYKAVSRELLEQQKPDGSWEHGQFKSQYATAMALLILEIPMDFLPMYER